MTDLLSRVVVPLASGGDGTATGRGLRRYLEGTVPEAVVAVHVVEKAGGAADKASVEQREEYAEEVFANFVAALSGTDTPVETEVLYGTDVAETVFEAAADHDATAIAFTPREGGLLTRLLTGDVSHRLVTGADRPVVVLPRDDADDPPAGTDDPDATEAPEGPDSPADPDDSDEEQV